MVPRLKTRVLPTGLVVIGLLVWAPVAAAETLSASDARAEVRAAAAMVVENHDATSFRLVHCSRLGARHIHCTVRFRNVRRAGRTCNVTYSVSLRDANFATQASRPVCRG